MNALLTRSLYYTAGAALCNFTGSKWSK